MTKKNYFTEGQPVICARIGDRNGAVGIIINVTDSAFRVAWKMSPNGIPYPEDKTSRFALTALAPKLLDILDPVPETKRGFAFIYPLDMDCDIDTMVNAHRAAAEAEINAVQTDFFMIGGVHGDIRYDRSHSGCSTAPPCKKYLDMDDALSDAKEMAAQYNQSYVVLAVAAVVKPKSVEQAALNVDVDIKAGYMLEAK